MTDPRTLCRVWWEFALWGLLGAAANRGVRFLEDLQRVKGWPWGRTAGGPGAGPFFAAVAVHLFLGAAVAATLSSAAIVDNPFVAFGAGAGAVLAVKKAGSYAYGHLPSDTANDGPHREITCPNQGDDDAG